MAKRFLIVAGNIGAGKTTIAQNLASRLGWVAGHETVASNPYLPDFYRDMKQWAFHLQVYFLGDRAEQHNELAQLRQSVIIDRSIYEDPYIFARALHEMGNMTDNEFEAYMRVYKLVEAGLPKPDLLLYLDASVPVLMDRIASRARDIESGISADYLALLDRFYKEWLADFDLCPVLTIPANDYNFVTNQRHLDIIIEKIEEKLSGKEMIVFPPA